MNLFRWHI